MRLLALFLKEIEPFYLFRRVPAISLTSAPNDLNCDVNDVAVTTSAITNSREDRTMNAAVNNRPNQIGDLVRVKEGLYANQVGVLIEKGHSWKVELEDGLKITIAPRMAGFPIAPAVVTEPEVVDNVIAESATETAGENLTEADSPAPDATPVIPDALEAGDPAEVDTTPEARADVSESEATEVEATEAPSTEEPNSETTPEVQTPSAPRPRIRATLPDNIPDSLSKLSVRELWGLAKQRGVSVARTKADFLRIIEANFPEVNLATLKGKTLFDTVSSLHISRLRSKGDLLIILAETEPTTEAA